MRIYQELNTLDFKAQHLELEIQEKHQKNEKEDRRLHLPWHFFVWLAQLHPLAQDNKFLQIRDTVTLEKIPSFVILYGEISKKTTMW